MIDTMIYSLSTIAISQWFIFHFTLTHNWWWQNGCLASHYNVLRSGTISKIFRHGQLTAFPRIRKEPPARVLKGEHKQTAVEGCSECCGHCWWTADVVVWHESHDTWQSCNCWHRDDMSTWHICLSPLYKHQPGLQLRSKTPVCAPVIYQTELHTSITSYH